MKKKELEKIIVSVDIGTSQVKVLIGIKYPDKPIEIIGAGIAESKGITKGIVVDVESLSNSVLSAIEAAEDMADVEVDGVFINITGSHIKSFNYKGSTPINNEINQYEITEDNANNAISAAKAVSIPVDRRILHVVSQEFSIDGHGGVMDPVGMSGVKLEVEVHIVTGLVTALQNMSKCLAKADVQIEEIILNSLASASSTLLDEEKEMGVVLIDIGAGVSDIAIYVNDALKFSDIFPSGGNHVSSDIAAALRVPFNIAENIKKEHGSALRSLVPASEELSVPGVVGREEKMMPSRDLASIIEARMEETFILIKKKIQGSQLSEKIGSGIVLTGGGSLLKDIDKLAARVFNVPVKIGEIRGVGGIDYILESPEFSTSTGLLLHGVEIQKDTDSVITEKKRVFNLLIDFVKKIFDKNDV